MKRMEDIEKMGLEELDRIGADKSIPVPADWSVRLPDHRVRWATAAAAALLVGLAGWGLMRPAAPKDTFDDPYLAYAAVEQALEEVSRNVRSTAEKVNAAEENIDKLNYWK